MAKAAPLHRFLSQKPEDVRTLTEPPVVGQRYLVPCVFRLVYRDWVPVTGAQHADPEAFCNSDFGKVRHYHYDARFVSNSFIKELWGSASHCPLDSPERWQYAEHWILAQVLGARDNVQFSIELRPRRCVRPQPIWTTDLMPFPHDRFTTFASGSEGSSRQYRFMARIEEECRDRKIADISNPVCPHRAAPLGSQPVDADGCVICPLHGLKISLVTGQVVPRFTDAEREEARCA